MGAVSAVLLKCGSGVEPEPVVINGLESIQSLVGGNIEAVRVFAQKRDTDEPFELVGYCDDEGRIKDSEMNWLASALFRQEIRGNVVVVTDAGDGEDGDVPDTFVKWLMSSFLQRVAETYNEATFIAEVMRFAVENHLVPEEEIMEVMNSMGQDIANEGQTPETMQKMNELLEKILKAVQDYNAEEDGVQLVSEIEDWLKTETEK
ncbi:MAG: DUF3846 domain-containing protein [bacterium]|jgi:hypothetical protein